MKSIKFTITDKEVLEVAESLGVKDLSNKQVQLALEYIECDEILWKKINASIVSAIQDLPS